MYLIFLPTLAGTDTLLVNRDRGPRTSPTPPPHSTDRRGYLSGALLHHKQIAISAEGHRAWPQKSLDTFIVNQTIDRGETGNGDGRTRVNQLEPHNALVKLSANVVETLVSY